MPVPSWFAEMAMVPDPAFNPEPLLILTAFWALRLTFPDAITGLVLKAIAFVVIDKPAPMFPPDFVPFKIVVPVPAVCVTAPVVSIVELNVTSFALVTVIVVNSAVLPTVLANAMSPPPAVNDNDRRVDAESEFTAPEIDTLLSNEAPSVSIATLASNCTAPVNVTVPVTVAASTVTSPPRRIVPPVTSRSARARVVPPSPKP